MSTTDETQPSAEEVKEEVQEEVTEEAESAPEGYTDLDNAALQAQIAITDSLLKWMLENGAIMPHLYFKYYAVDFRGVAIDTDFPDDEIMVEIPPALLITVERGKASGIGQAIQQSGIHIRSHAFVACFLLQEKHNPESYWKPYLDVLPKSFRHIPTDFNDEEMEYLRGSLTVEDIEDRRERYSTEYKNLRDNVPAFQEFTQAEYTWARNVVLTRIFGITVDGQDTSSLVPMADMLNHKYPAETYWTFDQDREAFTITSQKDFVADEQVYDSYGRKCNTEFFMNYGFVPEEANPNNECKLIMSFPEDSDLFAYKLLLLPSDLHQVQVSKDYESDECAEMWAYLRLAFCTSAEFFQLTGGGYDVDDVKDISPRNIRNEMEVLRNLADFCQQSLDDFSDPVEVDNKLLEEAESLGLSRNIQNCIRTRRSEKQVLHWYITMCETMLGFLEETTTKDEFLSMAQLHPLVTSDADVRYYAHHVIHPLLHDDHSVGDLIVQFNNMRVEDYQSPRYRFTVPDEIENSD